MSQSTHTQAYNKYRSLCFHHTTARITVSEFFSTFGYFFYTVRHDCWSDKIFSLLPLHSNIHSNHKIALQMWSKVNPSADQIAKKRSKDKPNVEKQQPGDTESLIE